jgi:hypothetical protein
MAALTAKRLQHSLRADLLLFNVISNSTIIPVRSRRKEVPLAVVPPGQIGTATALNVKCPNSRARWTWFSFYRARSSQGTTPLLARKKHPVRRVGGAERKELLVPEKGPTR